MALLSGVQRELPGSLRHAHMLHRLAPDLSAAHAASPSRPLLCPSPQIDMLFSMLLIAALVVVAFVRPYRLLDSSAGSLLLGCGMLLPLAWGFLARATYAGEGAGRAPENTAQTRLRGVLCRGMLCPWLRPRGS